MNGKLSIIIHEGYALGAGLDKLFGNGYFAILCDRMQQLQALVISFHNQFRLGLNEKFEKFTVGATFPGTE